MLTKYETHVKPHFEQIMGWIRSGHTEGSIAKRLGVDPDTWTAYKKKYSEFSDLVGLGGQNSTALVVNKLYQRAIGFNYDEVTTEVKTTDKGKTTKTAKKTTKTVIPDVSAISIILYNRDPENWKNKHEYTHTGSISSPLENASMDEINQIIQQGNEIINGINAKAKKTDKRHPGNRKAGNTVKAKNASKKPIC